jgi:urease accessory protein UreE
MITELSIIDKIEVLEDGQIQVRHANKVLRDGVEIAKTYHRQVLAPGDDLSEQDAKVVAVAKAVWAKP